MQTRRGASEGVPRHLPENEESADMGGSPRVLLPVAFPHGCQSRSASAEERQKRGCGLRFRLVGGYRARSLGSSSADSSLGWVGMMRTGRCLLGHDGGGARRLGNAEGPSREGRLKYPLPDLRTGNRPILSTQSRLHPWMYPLTDQQPLVNRRPKRSVCGADRRTPKPSRA